MYLGCLIDSNISVDEGAKHGLFDKPEHHCLKWVSEYLMGVSDAAISTPLGGGGGKH